MGLLDSIDNLLGTRLGILLNDPRAAMAQMNQQAGAFNQASLLAVQAERNAMNGIPSTPEQLAAKQMIDEYTRDLAMGFAGNIKPVGKTPYELAQEVAQKNAVEMLGLPANNTAMDRAKALGYDTPAFHGTNRNFKGFSNEMLGATTGAKSAQKAHFLAANPEMSNTYVSTSGVYNSSPPAYEKLVKNKKAFEEFNAAPDAQSKWMVLEKYGMNYGSGQVMPVLAKLGNPKIKDYQGVGYRDETFNDLIKSAKKSKKDSVVFKNTYDIGPYEGQNVQSDVYAIFNPANIRSRFAAFDPARVNEPDLLAAGVPLGLLAGTNIEMPKKKEKRK
jgi:hypothetical protein